MLWKSDVSFWSLKRTLLPLDGCEARDLSDGRNTWIIRHAGWIIKSLTLPGVLDKTHSS